MSQEPHDNWKAQLGTAVILAFLITFVVGGSAYIALEMAKRFGLWGLLPVLFVGLIFAIYRDMRDG